MTHAVARVKSLVKQYKSFTCNNVSFLAQKIKIETNPKSKKNL